MAVPGEFRFTRYLAAKKSVDDRALNRGVWEALRAILPGSTPEDPTRVLEIGAGIGTMVERMVDWGMLKYARYTAIDSEGENISEARRRLVDWGKNRGARVRIKEQGKGLGLLLSSVDWELEVELEVVDLFDLAARKGEDGRWDLLVAHAFLDLVDLPSTLPLLFGLLGPGRLFYFTIVYDGLTILEPEVDPGFDAQILALYHRTMDERFTKGRPSGDSRTGRHLFGHLRETSAEIVAAGSSDWIVYPSKKSYPGNEAYFLHFIVHTIDQALHGHSELDAVRFEEWIRMRHTQIEEGVLVYAAHQLDFVGRSPGDIIFNRNLA